MAFFRKHKNKIMTVALTLGAIAGIKFVARQFPQVPLIGNVARFL